MHITFYTGFSIVNLYFEKKYGHSYYWCHCWFAIPHVHESSWLSDFDDSYAWKHIFILHSFSIVKGCFFFLWLADQQLSMKVILTLQLKVKQNLIFRKILISLLWDNLFLNFKKILHIKKKKGKMKYIFFFKIIC